MPSLFNMFMYQFVSQSEIVLICYVLVFCDYMMG